MQEYRIDLASGLVWHDIYVKGFESDALESRLKPLIPRSLLAVVLDAKTKLYHESKGGCSFVSTNMYMKKKFHRLDILWSSEFLYTISYDAPTQLDRSALHPNPVEALLTQDIPTKYRKFRGDFDAKLNELQGVALSKLNDNRFEKLLSLNLDLSFYQNSLEFLTQTLQEIPDIQNVEAALERLAKLRSSADLSKSQIQSTLDLQMPVIQHQTNETMKKLAVISILFMPLNFLSAVYGMNFANVPELNWDYGYQSFWVAVFILVFLIIWVLKRNRLI